MALMTPPPSGPVSLDKAPLHPPLQSAPADSGPTSPLLATPQAMAVRGLMMMEEGAKLLQTAIPSIDPMTVDIVTLKQAVPGLLATLSAPMTGSAMAGGAPQAGMGMFPAAPGPMM